MKSVRHAIATALLSGCFAANAGEVVVYVTEDGQAMDNVAIAINGEKKLVDKSGFISFELTEGEQLVELSQFGEFIGEFSFALSSNADQADVQVDVLGGELLPSINVFNPSADAAVAFGQLAGVIESSETGGPIVGAVISVVDTELQVMTDENGQYQIELPRGQYNVTIEHPSYGKRDVRNVRVMGNVTTGTNFALSLSGDGVIEEVVAIGSYIPSNATAQQRDATGVLDAIGAEQFSKFGDSDAASALKRVTGVTVSDGKYAVVRGLNERYTSVLLNGAQLSSPDPTRRVVPLDLFPSGVISTIGVEKTATASRPADSAGATIDIVTATPESEPSGKVSVKLGYRPDTTGESTEFQRTSTQELFGFGSSGRDLSQAAKDASRVVPRPSFTGEDGADLLELDQLITENITINPDVSLSGQYEDLLVSTSFGDISYKVGAKYSNEWMVRDEKRAVYEPVGNGAVQEADEYEERRAINEIDVDLDFSAGLAGDNYNVNSQTLLLRKTVAEFSESIGVRGENREFIIERNTNWEERQFLVQQFSGDYDFDFVMPTTASSSLTYSQAKLELPDAISYQLNAGQVDTPKDNTFNPRADDRSDQATLDFVTRPSRSYLELIDDSIAFNIDFSTDIRETDLSKFNINYGASIFDKTRSSETYVFNYDVIGTLPDERFDELSDVVTQDNFDQEIIEVFPVYDPSATYDGTIINNAFYIAGNYEVFDRYSLNLGLRQESQTLDIETDSLRNQPAITANIEDSELYTSLNATYFAGENLQFRASYFNSINRPDFREVAPAQFRDAASGDLYIGNPTLTESYIDNIDLRAEYYFSDAESVSLAFFRKDFEDAIERTSTVVSGSSNTILFSFDNNGDAYAQGVELSLTKDIEFGDYFFNLTSNVALFDTGIEIFSASGNFVEERKMQGQPDVLANLGLSFDSLDETRSYTLAMVHTGESLFAVSVNPLLDDQMQSARTEIDFNIKQSIMDDFGSLSLSIKNLTNSKVEQTQNGRITRSFKPGTKINLGFNYEF